MNYWLVKQEPDSYPFSQLISDGETAWTGVRNFQARNNLSQMRKGDRVLYYHTGAEKAVVGIARVEREAYKDPTSSEERWVAVDISAVKALKSAVTLDKIKASKQLSDIPLLKQSRLSVMPLTKEMYSAILEMA
jgi:predicted RNA-binding protein with PUA-like domain